MVLHKNLLLILVLMAVNSRFGLALPHQSIRFSFEKVSLFFLEMCLDQDNLLKGIANKTVRSRSGVFSTGAMGALAPAILGKSFIDQF